MKHLLKLLDLSKEEITELLDLADRLKADTKAGVEHHILNGKTMGLVLEPGDQTEAFGMSVNRHFHIIII